MAVVQMSDAASWTIRSMGADDVDRIAATAAARRMKEPIADWIRRAIRRALESERTDVGPPYEIMSHASDRDSSRLLANGPNHGSDSAIRLMAPLRDLTIDEIDRAATYIARIAETRRLKHPPRSLARAQRLLEQRLGLPGPGGPT